jgi:hypothetical protein
MVVSTKAGLRVLVCGGRDYEDYATAYAVLDEIQPRMIRLMSGGATGADTIARHWAISRGVLFDVYEAEWKLYGRSAGPRRNQRMLDEGKPNLIVAFPGGRGTADMLSRARAAGVPVEVVGGEP